MKTTIKTLVIAIAAILFSAIDAAAQKISAAAIVDQHYASQTSNYKLMMIGLATAYGVYVMLQVKRKREMNRFLGRN